MQLDENDDLRSRLFVQESDVLSALPPRLKAQFRIARSCLLAMNRIEVIRRDEMDLLMVPLETKLEF